jgi:hypothetical protein
VPTYVEAVSEASSQAYPNGNSTPEVNRYYFPTPFPVAAGDCVLVDVTRGSTTAFSGLAASDNGGNSYSVLTTSADSTDGGEIAVLASSASAPASLITVSWTGEAYGVHAGAVVFADVLASSCTSPDQTWTNSSSSDTTTITAGSGAKSPSASGDLIVEWTLGTGGAVASYTPGSQSDITWSLVPGSTQLNNPTASQWGIYDSTSAINPTMTMGTSTTYAAIALAIKAGSSGSAPPTGKVATAVAHWDVSGWTGNTGTTVTEQMAVSGNALVITGSSYCDSSGNGYTITAISDSASDTWVKDQSVTYAADYPEYCPNAGYSYIWHALNVTPTSNLAVTLTMNTVSASAEEPDTALTVYDVKNLTALDTSAGTYGNQIESGTLTTSSLTPSESGEFVVTVESEDFYGVKGVTGAFTNFEVGSWVNGSGSDQCNSGYTPPNIQDECNGAAWMNSTGTSSISAQYTSTGIAAAYWASAIAAFK